MKLSHLLGRLKEVQTEGSSYLAKCPSHNDGRPSLLITVTDDSKLLLHCRAGCKKTAVLNSLDLKMSDLFDVDVDLDDAVLASTGPPAPPLAAHISQISDYLSLANQEFRDSEAASYAFERFGLDPEFAYATGLGFDPGSLPLEWLTPAYRGVPRLVVPFYGTDGLPRGFQSRALQEDPVRWCGPMNPPGHAWTKMGVFDYFSENDSNLLITEGPGDALTAIAHQTGALLVRGAALSRNESLLRSILAVTHDRRILLAGDNDESGLDFNLTLGSKLAEAGRQVHTLSIEQGGDLTDWRAEAGESFPQEFQRGLRRATRIDTGRPGTPPPPEDPAELFDFDDPLIRSKQTDEGNGLRLASRIGDNWTWLPSHGWHEYRSGAWSPSDNSINLVVQGMLQETQDIAAAMAEVAQHLGPEEGPLLEQRASTLFRWAHSSENSPRFDRVEVRARKYLEHNQDEFDQHDHLLVVKNGVVNLRTGELGPHDRELYMTQSIPFDYIPDAPAPRWTRFLSEIMVERLELVDYLQVLLGYSITGSTDEAVLGVFHGSGANGKSVLLNAIRHVMKPIVGIAAYSTFEKKYGGGSTADLAAIAEKRMVLAQEGERNAPMSEALLKRATGSDPMTVRHLYRDHFTFEPKWTLILSTNYRPRLSGNDVGLWRRIKLVPFDACFLGEDQDRSLPGKLRQEAEGILSWLIEGAIKFYQDGLVDPPIIQSGLQDYRETSDELAGFTDLVIIEEPGAEVSGRELYEAFRDWCLEEGINAWSRRAFFSAITERYPDVRKYKKTAGVHFDGLRLAKG